MCGFSPGDLVDLPSVIAHHGAVALLWLASSPLQHKAPSSSTSLFSGPSLAASQLLAHAVLQRKALFSLVEHGAQLSSRERTLARHSHWVSLPASLNSSVAADGLKQALESVADAIGEIIWPGGSRDRVFTPKCQLRLRRVYSLNENADVTVRSSAVSNSTQQSSNVTLICMIVPTLSPPDVTSISRLPLLDVFLTSFTRSVGCDGLGGGEGFKFGIYVGYDQVRIEKFSFSFSLKTTDSVIRAMRCLTGRVQLSLMRSSASSMSVKM
jgi:hypothetical protein